jgi:hypothetical protein
MSGAIATTTRREMQAMSAMLSQPLELFPVPALRTRVAAASSTGPMIEKENQSVFTNQA